MKNITLFFCDIMNTFLGKSINEEEDINNFISNLKYIKEKNNSHILFFTFASEEHPEEIKKLENYFSSFINDQSIKIIKNSNEQELKISKMSGTIKDIVKNYIIDEIYFADDCKIYHELIDVLLQNHCKDIKINYILTKHGGISEINSILEGSLKVKTYIM